MLSDWRAPYIQSLMRLIETQSKVTLATWAIGYSEKVLLPIWPSASRMTRGPQTALNAAREWLSGKIKLPQAKEKNSLKCHSAARESEGDPAGAGCCKSHRAKRFELFIPAQHLHPGMHSTEPSQSAS